MSLRRLPCSPSPSRTGVPLRNVPNPFYGGYSNPRGEIFLFAKELVFRVNLKTSVLQQRAPLNPGAQARYDATPAGDDFDYGNRTFRRLSHEIIADICGAHRFRLSAGGHYS